MVESSLSLPSARFTPAEFTDEELADLNADFERMPASKIIQWAVDSFGPYLSLAASMAPPKAVLAVTIGSFFTLSVAWSRSGCPGATSRSRKPVLVE